MLDPNVQILSLKSRCTVAVVALAMVSMIAGCASFVTANKRFNEGWRTGTVLQIAKATEIRVRFAKDCREFRSISDLDQFVLVRYTRSPRRYAYFVAPAPFPEILALGDKVEMNVENCDLPARKVQPLSVDSATPFASAP